MEFDQSILKCYLVIGTQDVNYSPAKMLDKVKAGLKNGITCLQYRDKGSSRLTPKQRLALGKKVRALASAYHVPLIVDDNLQLAKEIKADGIHVGQSDEKIEQVIRDVDGQMIIGYSCSTADEIKKANKLAIDYIGSGPVYPTSSKADADPVIGVSKLAELVKLSKHPIVAIGGITKERCPEVAKTNCAGAAMIAYLVKHVEEPNTIRQIKACFK